MVDVGMHNHIGDILLDVEVAALHAVEGQVVIQANTHGAIHNDSSQIKKDINDKQVFDTCGQHAETLRTVLGHGVMGIIG